MKLTQYQKSLVLRGIIIVVALVLMIFVVKKIKHSSFIASLHSNSSDTIEAPDITKEDQNSYSVPLTGLLFDNISDSKQIGKTAIASDSTTAYVYSISYPSIGVKSIDSVLNTDISGQINSFKETYASYGATDEHTRASFNIDYQSYVTGDSIVSVIFTSTLNLPLTNESITSVTTHNFLLKTGEEFTFDRIMAGDIDKLFSTKTASYLENDDTLKETMSDKAYKAGYEADINNFSKFTFSNSGLSLYFEPGKIADKAVGVISVTLPPDVVLPFLIYDPFKQVTLPPEGQSGNSAEPVTSGAITIPEGADPLYQGEIDPSKPMIALTFDDGPRSLTTNRILDTLEKYGCRATFFVLGSRLSSEIETAKRAHDLGCDIGNHTFDHMQLSKLSKKDIKKQISKTNKYLIDNAGFETQFVRTPYGETTDKVVKNVKYPIILWNIDTEDWRSRDAKKIYNKVMKCNIEDGDIILMHDIYETTADAVKKLVPKLRKEGYQLVSISELFQYKGISPDSSSHYFNIK